MIVYLLALIDVHTLFVLLFSSFLSPLYIFSGFSIAFLKGFIFFVMSRDLFSLIDMIMAVLMLLLLFGIMPVILKVLIFVYLVYKIGMSLL